MRPIAILLLSSSLQLAQAQSPPPPQDGLPPVPTVSAPPSGQKPRGFALEIHLGTQLAALAGAGNIGLIQGGFFAGYKLDRFIFGVGFDLARVASSMSVPGADTSQAATAFYFAPGIRATIVRSHDQRVDFFGQFDLGLGTSIDEQSPSPTGPQPNELRFRLYYNVAPGVRFWAHPQFSIGALAGVHGDFVYTKITQPNTNVSTSQQTTVTAIFAALQLMGVF
jgi:hypothetical protein